MPHRLRGDLIDGNLPPVGFPQRTDRPSGERDRPQQQSAGVFDFSGGDDYRKFAADSCANRSEDPGAVVPRFWFHGVCHFVFYGAGVDDRHSAQRQVVVTDPLVVHNVIM